MARLLDLPNEVLFQVANEVQVEDLENWASICRQTYAITTPLLERHRYYSRTYSTASDSIYDAIPTLLKEVLVNPHVGRYVRSVRLIPNQSRPRTRNQGVSRQAIPFSRMPTADLKRFRTAAMQVPVLQEEIVTSYKYKNHQDPWTEIIERAGTDVFLAILAPLLPNLRWVTYSNLNGKYDLFTRMLLSAPQNRNEPFARLSNLYLTSEHEQYCDRYWNSRNLMPYLCLPQLETITIRGLCDDVWDTISLEPGIVCSTKSLILEDCIASTRGLHEILQVFTDLQSFKYTNGSHPCNFFPFDPFFIRTSLLAAAKSTLRHLDFRAPERCPDFMGSFRSFETLETLRIDWRLLLPDMNRLSGWDDTYSNGGLHRLLPRSLGELWLYDEQGLSFTHYDEFINDILRAKLHTDILLRHFTIVSARFPPFHKESLAKTSCHLDVRRKEFKDKIGVVLQHVIQGSLKLHGCNGSTSGCSEDPRPARQREIVEAMERQRHEQELLSTKGAMSLGYGQT